MISFRPLWETMEKKHITTYRLEKQFNVSKGTIHNLKQGKSVTLNTIDNLCKILDCPVSDIIEFQNDKD